MNHLHSPVPGQHRPLRSAQPVTRALVTLLVAACLSLALALVGPAVPAGWGRTTDARLGPGERAQPSQPPQMAGRLAYQVAPGLTFRQWTRTTAHGPVRVSLLVADLDEPRLQLRYVSMDRVRQRALLTSMLVRPSVVAGVNANFFDIYDTGAPLGLGVDRGSILHGDRSGIWTTSLLVFGDRARIRRAAVRVAVVGRPEIRVTSLNSPYVPRHGIGLFTHRWGSAAGYHVVDGARWRYRGVDRSRRRDVHQVVVRDQRVVSNTRTLAHGSPVVDELLVGRGSGARVLRRLAVGQRVRFTWSVTGEPTLAISGSERLLAGGEVTVTKDVPPAHWPGKPGQLHARTAVGIDHETGDLLLVVVDGRQAASRGMTMVQLARLLLHLGAEDALNLDGGGSSTMVVRNPRGRVGVVNKPSDGEERRIANGIALLSTAPAG